MIYSCPNNPVTITGYSNGICTVNGKLGEFKMHTTDMMDDSGGKEIKEAIKKLKEGNEGEKD